MSVDERRINLERKDRRLYVWSFLKLALCDLLFSHGVPGVFWWEEMNRRWHRGVAGSSYDQEAPLRPKWTSAPSAIQPSNAMLQQRYYVVYQ
jgi:hypothetical protein